MSRKYLNERWCVRCGRRGPTPYLRDKWQLLNGVHSRTQPWVVLDIGCGNGRNSEFVRQHLTTPYTVISVDMAGDYGHQCTLGADKLPARTGTVDTILANYILMFLEPAELAQALSEIKRVARKGCKLMVELYAAKDSHATTDVAMQRLKVGLQKALGWTILHDVKGKFIAQKP